MVLFAKMISPRNFGRGTCSKAYSLCLRSSLERGFLLSKGKSHRILTIYVFLSSSDYTATYLMN
jgi:hypothetical protein